MAKHITEKPEIKYPKGENICVTCYDSSGNRLFLITHKPLVDIYFIYEFTGDGLVKLGKGQSPLELEAKFNVRKRMGVE